MRRYTGFIILLLFLFCGLFTQGQTTKTVGGAGANYATLKAAFDAINAGTITGAITLQITGSTTETATAQLNSSGTGSARYTSVKIYPTISGISISCNLQAPLIDLNGADNISIDGRINEAGITKDLTITNSCILGTSNTSTIRFINAAENNSIKYAILKGGSIGVYSGVLLFASDGSGNGNSGNLIDNCNLTGLGTTSRPMFVLYSYGTSGHENKNNTVSNCNVYDFFNQSQTSYGIYVYSNSSDWTISGNSFYETSDFTPSTSASYFCIKVYSTTGNNFLISGNYIGGQLASCGGSPWSIAVPQTSRFYGIHLDVGTTTPTSVQNNTIQNLNISNTNNIPFMGIDVNSGSANLGTVTGNTIGAPTGTGSITLTNATNTSISYGIYVISTGTVAVSNNTIGSMTTVGGNPNQHSLVAIHKASSTAGNMTISNNLVGSLTTPNSLQASSVSGSGSAQNVYGIYSTGVGTTAISNNTVAHLHNAYDYSAATSGQTTGIYTTGGANTIQNNTVRDLSCANGSSDPNANAAVIGIMQRSTISGQTIAGNTIYNLTSPYTGTRAVSLIGIYSSGGITAPNAIFGNMIYGFSIAATAPASTPAILCGIKLIAGSTTTYNNVVNLGAGVNIVCNISGIYENGSAGNDNSIWFNSVYIGGTPPAATTASTYALFSNANTNIRDFRNNIFYNARSGGTTGKHYAIRLNGTANSTFDNNDYFANGSNGVVGVLVSTDKTTLTAWQTATSQDAHSLSIDPAYASAGGTSPANYATSANLPGVSGTGITTDFNGDARSVVPKMGALESHSFVWQGGTSTNFATAGNWTGGVVPPDGSDISFASTPANDCALDQNRILGDITNAQSSKKLEINGKQLTVKGNLNFTNGAQMDATAASSVVVFAGTAGQNIPSGSFVSNTTDALTVNNSNGLTLNGDLLISQTLSLTSGSFNLGANTLTLNGGISTSAGTLTGGSATNISIGGSGASTTLPAVSLNNLTLNRSNGISLGGNVSIAGTLTLTTGSLTIGANTLNISGNSPTRTSGNLAASDAGATLTFRNSAAIALPVSFFTGSVNNLNITGAGGIAAASDFTVSGVLNLQSANPSATKGCLDLWDGSAMKTLTMGAAATTTGTGDVTGIVTRTSFSVNTPYSFGNQFTTINIAAGGVLPSSVSVKIVLSSSNLSWKTNAIHRYYDISQTGGTSATKVTLNLHYLDTELNGATEGNMHLFDYHVSGNLSLDDHGKSNDNTFDNWVGLSNIALTYIASGNSFPSKYWTLGTSTTANYTWLGANSSDWNDAANWTSGIPSSGKHVVIPDAGTTTFDPDLPSSTTIGSITIQAGGILNGGTSTALTLDGGTGAWDNMGTFNAGTSTVIFTNSAATMSDPTNFYNVTISDGASLTLGTDNTIRIEGILSLSSTGILNAASNHNTVEYNGADQTVVSPNGSTAGYHNLILSGTGTKTMPVTALSVFGDLSTAGSASVTALSALTIAGNVKIGAGSTFITGSYTHAIGGNFDNDGTFTSGSGNTIAMNGALAQTITGSQPSNFDKLNVDNSNGISQITNASVINELILTKGNLTVGQDTLGINGAISKIAGHIEVSPVSSISFGGSAALSLPYDLFTSTPSILNLFIDRSGGVTFGNQSMTVNGVMKLINGTLDLEANSLTLSGSSPTRTSGSLNASNAGATLIFANSSAIALPASFFSGVVNNLTISGTGGVTARSNFTVNGVLNLASANPSETKGLLDMVDNWNGYPAVADQSVYTLTMGSAATTTGIGDVSGTVRRAGISASTAYTYGNQFTTLAFTPGTMPSVLDVTIRIGATPPGKTNAIKRSYQIVPTGGSGGTVSANFHYLDSELRNSIDSFLQIGEANLSN